MNLLCRIFGHKAVYQEVQEPYSKVVGSSYELHITCSRCGKTLFYRYVTHFDKLYVSDDWKGFPMHVNCVRKFKG